MIQTLKEYIKRRVFQQELKESEVVEAYDLWAENYDSQPGNLMLDLDARLFKKLLEKADLKNKAVADIGCGTGRHWPQLFSKHPGQLTGYDVSPGMLQKLKDKFPAAEVRTITDNRFSDVGDESYDLIVSTLTVAHIEDIDEALGAWSRICKPAAEMIITDFHPDALAFGGKRTFTYHKKQMAVRNFVHPTDLIKKILARNGFKLVNAEEFKIDESVKHYYEEKNATLVYEKFKGFPIIYALHFRRGE